MRSFTAAALLATVGLFAGSSALEHYICTKSLPNALIECAEYFEISECRLSQYVEDSYPNCPDVKRLIRCALLNVGAWEDASGVRENVISNFFEPAAEDTCYVNRTRDCIAEALKHLDSKDYLGRAYESFLCYYRQYGNVIESEQFFPNEPLEAKQLLLSAINFAHIPRCELVQYSRGHIVDEPHFPALWFVWALRGGYYTIAEGTDLQALYNQFGCSELLSQCTKSCVEGVQQELAHADDKTKSYQTFRRCLKDLVPLDSIQKIALELVGGSHPAPPPCGCGPVCRGACGATHTSYYNNN
ncbi:uncharacterized protein LOC120425143 [Culex pipiens pallens]|uniref:uncharacterized protein LOC120425143 n=1 Tax=Culex pipiens pallens TaxID=42434 RepID=UPI0019547D23|nr:uncharacterized protein LOC120425143 [Culex pipiens pallens]